MPPAPNRQFLLSFVQPDSPCSFAPQPLHLCNLWHRAQLHDPLLNSSQITEALFDPTEEGLLTRRDEGDLDLFLLLVLSSELIPIIVIGVQNRPWNSAGMTHFDGSVGCWAMMCL